MNDSGFQLTGVMVGNPDPPFQSWVFFPWENGWVDLQDLSFPLHCSGKISTMIMGGKSVTITSKRHLFFASRPFRFPPLLSAMKAGIG